MIATEVERREGSEVRPEVRPIDLLARLRGLAEKSVLPRVKLIEVYEIAVELGSRFNGRSVGDSGDEILLPRDQPQILLKPAEDIKANKVDIAFVYGRFPSIYVDEIIRFNAGEINWRRYYLDYSNKAFPDPDGALNLTECAAVAKRVFEVYLAVFR